ncbi:MAG: TonB-dependent receptor [Lysobacteraceae bacterium]
MKRRTLTLAVGLTLIQHGVSAQNHDSERAKQLDQLVVTASPLRQTIEDILQPVSILSGEKLDARKQATLGRTLANEVGVQSSYFGPGVGRPIIRGQDGARVQVLSEGLATGDVSAVSVDHALSIEPFLADQIEVLRGPATLLYGSGAIGGAVNVVDGRIAESLPEQSISGRAEARIANGNNERSAMGRLDARTGNVVLHVDALSRKTDDYDIPGFAESAALRAEEEAEEGEGDGEHEHEEEAYGTLPNSALETQAGAVGLSWIGERGFLGASLSRYDTLYGVPGHQHSEHTHGGDEGEEDGEEHEEESVSIDLDQQRREIRAGLDDLGLLESLRFKFADTDYQHLELEGDEVGTRFDNRSQEARLEAVHAPLLGFAGALGIQWSDREFDAIGEEAFVPSTETSDRGLFWTGEQAFGVFKVDLGLRADNNDIQTIPQDLAPTRLIARDFDTHSASTAFKWDASDALHLTVGLDSAQRAPTAEELYSNGLHVATGVLEIGTDTLKKEIANQIELGLHWHGERVRASANVFSTWMDNYIYLSQLESVDEPGTVLSDDGVPIALWSQADARFIGIELEARFMLADNASGEWDLRVFGDRVNATLQGEGSRDVTVAVFHEDHTHSHQGVQTLEGNLPRIAPMRLGVDLDWRRNAWRASLSAVNYRAQNDVADYETPSDGYVLVDANLAWHHDSVGGLGIEWFVDAQNLFDEEARQHTSFLKDVAPLPGRILGTGIRVFF